MDSVALPASPKSQARRLRLRLFIVVCLGLIAIGVSIAVRRSNWAKERHLKSLSLEELALAIHDDPNDPLTFTYYGSALMKAGNLENSEKAFLRATQLNPKQFLAQLGLATVRMHLGNLLGAIQSFEAAQKISPKEPAPYLGLAQAYYQAGSPRQAIEPLKKIVEIQPENAAAWYNLGKIYGEARQSDLAYDAMQRAVKLDPKQADYWRHLGQLSRHYNRVQEAEDQLNHALQLNPEDPTTHYWLGQLYAQKGDTPELRSKAEQEFRAALARDPQMPEAYFELGMLYERQKDYAQAVTNFRRARDLDLSDDRSLLHLGQCLVKIGQTAEGQKLIKGATELSAAKREIENMQNRMLAEPQNRDLRLRMARLFRKYGNHPYAINQYMVYQKMGTPDPAVAQELADFQAELQRNGELPQQSSPPHP